MSIQDRIEKLIKQLSIKEKEELCKYIQAQYCVDDEASMSDEIIGAISDILYFVGYTGEIVPSTKLDDLFINSSLATENILIALENKFELVKITRGSKITTVGDIIELVSKTKTMEEVNKC